MLEDHASPVNSQFGDISWHPTKPDFKTDYLYTDGYKIFSIDSFARLCRAVGTVTWSPIIWRDGYRDGSNFLYADWGALDFDGHCHMAQVAKEFSDSISIVGTTKRHTERENRFRLIFKWSSRIHSLCEYQNSLKEVAASYDIDPCFDGARKFWPCIKIIQAIPEGFLQPVRNSFYQQKKHCDREITAMKKYASMGEEFIFPGNISQWLDGRDVEGQRNMLCHRAGKYLCWWGMSDEKIEDLILGSELPLNFYHSKKEAKNAIRSGIRRARKIRGE